MTESGPSEEVLPPRILGIDPGERRVGVAVSDPMGWTAQPVEVIDARGGDAAVVDRIREIAREYEAAKIVVGYQINMDGSHGPRAKVVDAFVARLAEATSIPVETSDERLTTVEAEDALRQSGMSWQKQRKKVDVVAAQLILQRYLDGRKS